MHTVAQCQNTEVAHMTLYKKYPLKTYTVEDEHLKTANIKVKTYQLTTRCKSDTVIALKCVI